MSLSFNANRIESLIRSNIKNLVPYSAKIEYDKEQFILLDANESPFGKYNRYPDPLQLSLKKELSKNNKISTDNIFIGVGSDGVIDSLIRLFCEPNQDKIVTLPPTFSMYKARASVNSIGIIEVPLTEQFEINIDATLVALEHPSVKMVFICNPNNPTTNTLSWEDIKKILETFDGMVILDEAYIDFSSSPSALSKIKDYPNLIVLQTLSKVWGYAHGRIGMAYAHKTVIDYLNKAKIPYNIPGQSQQDALAVLKDKTSYQKTLSTILAEKKKLAYAFSTLPFVEKVYPSDTNFFLIKVKDSKKLCDLLINEKIVIRNLHADVENCVRIAIGSPSQNKQLIDALQKINL